MLFSRSEGRAGEPPCNTFYKGFGKLYTGDPQKDMQQIKQHSWQVIWWGKFNIPLSSRASKYL